MSAVLFCRRNSKFGSFEFTVLFLGLSVTHLQVECDPWCLGRGRRSHGVMYVSSSWGTPWEGPLTSPWGVSPVVGQSGRGSTVIMWSYDGRGRSGLHAEWAYACLLRLVVALSPNKAKRCCCGHNNHVTFRSEKVSEYLNLPCCFGLTSQHKLSSPAHPVLSAPARVVALRLDSTSQAGPKCGRETVRSQERKAFPCLHVPEWPTHPCLFLQLYVPHRATSVTSCFELYAISVLSIPRIGCTMTTGSQ